MPVLLGVLVWESLAFPTYEHLSHLDVSPLGTGVLTD